MKLGYVAIALVLLVITVVSIAGFRGDKFTKPPFEIFPDMNYQEKVKDQVPSAFFADGKGNRLPVPGTVAEEMPGKNDYWSTGKWDETHWGDGIPVHDAIDGGRPLQIDAENMARGRERYSISCEVCHGAVGDGKGITSQYGLNGAASYQTDRLRTDSAGDIFNTITNGKGQMLGYGYNIAIDDRWRIIMYIRALQRSQNATYDDASPEEQAELDKAKKAATPPPAPALTPADSPPAGAPAGPSPNATSTPPATNAPNTNAPAPAGTLPPAKPSGSASNENHTGKFHFDVGYQFDGSDPHVLAPALKVENRIESVLRTTVLSVNASHRPTNGSTSLRFDVTAQVLDLASVPLLDLALDIGGRWQQPNETVRFVPAVVTGPLKLDYGTPYVGAVSGNKKSHPVAYLSQSTMTGWYDGIFFHQF